MKRQVTNWENIYKQYDKELLFFIYNDSSNKKMTDASKRKMGKRHEQSFYRIITNVHIKYMKLLTSPTMSEIKF